jgi:hypothetical protein
MVTLFWNPFENARFLQLSIWEMRVNLNETVYLRAYLSMREKKNMHNRAVVRHNPTAAVSNKYPTC